MIPHPFSVMFSIMFTYSFDQMPKMKVSKKKGPSIDSDSEDYSPSPEREPPVKKRPTSTKVGASKNKRGRGTGNPPGQGRGNPPRQSRAQSSASALGHPSSSTDEPEDDDINLSYLVDSVVSMRRPNRDRRDPAMVNYKRGGNSVENLRYSDDPREEQRSFLGDIRFWFPHQGDWYESVIMSYKHVTTEMKWID